MTETVYTRAQLATFILKSENIIDLEETPTAAELDEAEAIIEAIYGEFVERRISLPAASDEALPAKYLMAVANRIGVDVLHRYGGLSIADAEMAKPLTEKALRVLAAKPENNSVLAVEYF